MKNIQIISSSNAAEEELFAATDEEFALFFRDGENIAFIERVVQRAPKVQLYAALSRVLGERPAAPPFAPVALA